MTKKLKTPVKKLTKETPIKKVTDQEAQTVNKVVSEVKPDIEVKPEAEGLAQDQLMQDVLELVSATFRIKDGFVVTAFTDGGSKCSITFNNKDFEVSVKCKSLYQLGLRD